ncbi:MAG: glutathione S-transferase [Roseivivax sp.]|nr:glutathione S-transferase [Roseivivax sp.]
MTQSVGTLYLGDYSYSSWSLRGWLLVMRFGLSASVKIVDFSAGASVAEQMQVLPPARTVPALALPDGGVLTDSIAIAEELATRHPAAGHWPSDPVARAGARSLTAEMHSGFGALRSACPMNLRVSHAGFAMTEGVRADLDRIEALWSWARGQFGAQGPWLFGTYSAADAFYAPVAARIAGYDLPVGAVAQDYVSAHLSDPAFRRWRAMGLARGEDLARYAKDLPRRPWPGPAPRPARAVESGPSVNDACPYSGKPVSHFLEMGGAVYGFCNAFCRDKTVADPEAWPAFMALVAR